MKRMKQQGMLPFAATLIACAVPGVAHANSAGPPTDIAVVNNWDSVSNTYTGRLEVFSIQPNGELQHNWQTTANDGWNGWDTTCAFGGFAPVTGFAVAQRRDGTLEVIAVDSTGDWQHKFQTPVGGFACGWSNWFTFAPAPEFNGSSMTNLTTPVVSTAFRLTDGANGYGNGQRSVNKSLELFANNGTTAVTAWQLEPTSDSSGWIGWNQVDTTLGTLAAASLNWNPTSGSPSGMLVFGLWPSGGAGYSWDPGLPAIGWATQALPYYGNVCGGTDVPHIIQLVVGQNADSPPGRLEAFGLTDHGSVYHVWETTAGQPSSWTTCWESLGSGKKMSQIAVGQDLKGELEVFGVTDSQSPFHLFQTSPGGGWTNWAPLGCGHFDATELVVAQNNDGRLEVFDRNSNGTISHVFQLGTQLGSPTDTWSCFVQL